MAGTDREDRLHHDHPNGNSLPGHPIQESLPVHRAHQPMNLPMAALRIRIHVVRLKDASPGNESVQTAATQNISVKFEHVYIIQKGKHILNKSSYFSFVYVILGTHSIVEKVL